MKKNLLLILFIISVFSCSRDSNIKEISNSFEQFINNLEVGNTSHIELNMPFLSNLTSQEQRRILNPFRNLAEIKYDIEIKQNSETVYYLQIKTGASESLWTNLFIPYEQNEEGKWVMAPLIKSVQTFDIIPAKK